MDAVKICCTILIIFASVLFSEQHKCFECTELEVGTEFTTECGNFSQSDLENVVDCGDAPCATILVWGSRNGTAIKEKYRTCGTPGADTCAGWDDEMPAGWDGECYTCDDADFCNQALPKAARMLAPPKVKTKSNKRIHRYSTK